jgi:hypothetical protein
MRGHLGGPGNHKRQRAPLPLRSVLIFQSHFAYVQAAPLDFANVFNNLTSGNIINTIMRLFSINFSIWGAIMNLIFLVRGSPPVEFDGPDLVEAGGIHNIHLTYLVPINGTLSLHYGPCNIKYHVHAHHRIGITFVGNHPLASQHAEWEGQLPRRFVWIVSSDLVDQGCLHAFSGNTIVGTSSPIAVVKRTVRKRARTVLGDISDAEGPWFDGVEYLKEKEPEMLFVAQSKAKTVGIIGAGMSGLMTSVSFCQPSVSQDLTICDSYFSRVQVSITGESLKHPIVLVGEFVPHTSTVPLPMNINTKKWAR